MMEDNDKIPFTEHLVELRDRMLKCFYAVGIGFLLSYGFRTQIFDLLARPLIDVMNSDGKMIYTGLPEAFFTYLKVAFISGVMVASPVILYQFWMFVAPGLYNKERKMLIPIMFLSSFFFIGGALFGYFFVFPYGYKFFLGFETDSLQALPAMRDYYNFSSKLLIAFGIVFELPLVITFMAKLGLVTPAFLRKNRKYAIVIFFIGAALITPPDVVTQVFMALPLAILYELSIFGAVIFGRKSPVDEENGA